MPRYDIHLKDPATGKVIIYEDDFDFHDNDTMGGAEWVTFMYTRGNYACDCNRSSFMGIDELDCGHTIELIKIVEHGTTRTVWPDEYYVKMAVSRDKYQFKLVPEGEPRRFYLLDKDDKIIGGAVNTDVSFDGFSFNFYFEGNNMPIDFIGKSIVDYKILEGELVFNLG